MQIPPWSSWLGYSAFTRATRAQVPVAEDGKVFAAEGPSWHLRGKGNLCADSAMAELAKIFCLHPSDLALSLGGGRFCGGKCFPVACGARVVGTQIPL